MTGNKISKEEMKAALDASDCWLSHEELKECIEAPEIHKPMISWFKKNKNKTVDLEDLISHLDND